nr:hypothetical protein [Dyella sp. ASV24]
MPPFRHEWPLLQSHLCGLEQCCRRESAGRARRIASAFFCNTGECTAGARPHITTDEDVPLAKPNYSFEKRQREIAKKKKQDTKQAKKEASRDGAKTPSTANASTAERT